MHIYELSDIQWLYNGLKQQLEHFSIIIGHIRTI